jgi:RimJ/RimL family protein N-acetyltransferase
MAVFSWAAERGVGKFRLSISPHNDPSLAMAQKMGFTRVGEQWDDIDGLEYVLEAAPADVLKGGAAVGSAALEGRTRSSDR